MSEANFKLFGLSLWVLGRQFPNSNDYWDGNWLNVRALVEAPGARVEQSGAFVRTDEIDLFFRQLCSLDASLTGEAVLECLEPTLRIVLRLTRGSGQAEIAFSPDHMTQSHEFTFSLDQSYLKPMLADLSNILSDWPVISSP